MPHPVTKCATDNPGEGCGRVYPKKTQPGKCLACDTIDNAEGEDRARKEVRYKQYLVTITDNLMISTAMGYLPYMRYFMAAASTSKSMWPVLCRR